VRQYAKNTALELCQSDYCHALAVKNKQIVAEFSGFSFGEILIFISTDRATLSFRVVAFVGPEHAII